MAEPPPVQERHPFRRTAPRTPERYCGPLDNREASSDAERWLGPRNWRASERRMFFLPRRAREPNGWRSPDTAAAIGRLPSLRQLRRPQEIVISGGIQFQIHIPFVVHQNVIQIPEIDVRKFVGQD